LQLKYVPTHIKYQSILILQLVQDKSTKEAQLLQQYCKSSHMNHILPKNYTLLATSWQYGSRKLASALAVHCHTSLCFHDHPQKNMNTSMGLALVNLIQLALC